MGMITRVLMAVRMQADILQDIADHLDDYSTKELRECIEEVAKKLRGL